MVSGEEELEEGPDLEPIHNMAQALSKAVGAKRLYMENNPMYQKAMARLVETFPPIWDQQGDLELQLTETDIIFEQVPIYSEAKKSESVSWVLFKDGIRSLTLYPGVEDEELVRFLGVVNSARALPADSEDDMITLLWEEDFENIAYEFVELGMGDVPPIDIETVAGSAATQSAGKEGGSVTAKEESEGKTAGGETTQEVEVQEKGIELDTRPYFLERQEIEYLKGEIEREYSQDLSHNVIDVLFDIMELEADEPAQDELLGVLEKFVPYFLEERDFRLVTHILQEVEVVAASGATLNEGQRTRLLGIADRLSDGNALDLIIRAIEEASPPATSDELEELIGRFSPVALGPIMNTLPSVKSQRLRDRLQKAVPVLAEAAPDELTRALSSEDKGVVHHAIELITEYKVASAVPGLVGLLQSDNTGVRRAAVDALGKIATPGAMHELVKAVDDADATVRVAAVRFFAEAKNMGAFEKIERALVGKHLPRAELTEKAAFFDSYGALAGPGGVNLLAPILNSGGFMKKKSDPDWRACAANALGKIGTEEARDALRSAEKDKDPVVRNAVKKALEMES